MISPLDWGLGHASRSIAIVRMLLDKNVIVVLAGSGESFALMKMEFPELEFIELPNYQITLIGPFHRRRNESLPEPTRRHVSDVDVLDRLDRAGGVGRGQAMEDGRAA